jgi:ubiquinone/menaquinone biosynthesis C-methylase UbiE
MASPYTQPDSAKHMYDSRASKYDDSHHPVFARHVVQSLGLKPGERVLDLACGTGLVTLPAAQEVGSNGLVIGIDVSDGMLAELQTKRDKDPDQYSHVTIFNHDITKLQDIKELEKGSFDAISCASALVLLREPGVALQNWAEYLKPGGRLITDITDGDNMPQSIAMENVYCRLRVEPPNNRVWAKDDASLKRVLQQAGLEVEKIWFQKSIGAGTTYHSIDEAEQKFEEMIYRPPNKALVDAGLIEKARPMFKEEWKKLAVHDGKIKETDGVWVGLARKPASSEPVGRGSCACGAVSWTSFSYPTASSNCHCVTCRQISGSPYITFMDFPLSKLIFSPPFGKPYMKTFKASEYAERGFCGECGSTLTMWYKADPDTISVTAGSIDEDKSAKGFYKGSEKHIYVGSVPSWYNVPDDGLPRQETMKSAGYLLAG